MQKVISFGEALVDLLISNPSDHGSTFIEKEAIKSPGGAPANVASTVSKLGGKAYFVGKFSEDQFGQFLQQSLTESGVDLSYAINTSTAKTALAYITLDKDGERSFSFSRDNTADLLFRIDDFSPDCFSHNGIFHLCSNTLTHPNIFNTTQYGLSKARDAGMIVSFDVNLRLNLWPMDRDPLACVWSLIEQVQILKLSTEELIFICGDRDENSVIQQLLKAGVKLILVTNGAHLVNVITQRSQTEAYPPTVATVDSTAAGDAFMGGLLYQLSSQSVTLDCLDSWLSDEEALICAVAFAGKCGAITVTREGSISALPTMDEVMAFPSTSSPVFNSKSFLLEHISSIMDFYHPHCIDEKEGGFIQHFRDDSSVYDYETRHLVSSTRFVFNYAMAAKQFDNAEYLAAVRHGVKFLREGHYNPKTGGYAWVMSGKTFVDSTNYCYGFAFVLLAYSVAYKAGVAEAKAYIDETFNTMEAHFWSESDGLYCDEIDEDWCVVSDYRGQNANMHTCEALIMAYEATQDKEYLNRALLIAKNVCQRQASLAKGLIWEHYDSNWKVDWLYNKDNPKHLFKPWGFQIGHLAEWAKLLLVIERYINEDWLFPKAKELFDSAVSMGWDSEYGGLYYGVDLEGIACDIDKYFWVQAEAIAAAALLAKRTGEGTYWGWYRRIWSYSWHNMIDHTYGAWFRILDRRNNKYDEFKSPAGKTDYHTMGACYEIMNVLNDEK